MTDTREPKVGDKVKGLGTISAVYVGYVHVAGDNPALQYMRLPTYVCKWDEESEQWMVE